MQLLGLSRAPRNKFPTTVVCLSGAQLPRNQAALWRVRIIKVEHMKCKKNGVFCQNIQITAIGVDSRISLSPKRKTHIRCPGTGCPGVVGNPELLEFKEHWTTLWDVGLNFECSCVEQGVGVIDPCGSLSTWDILWFCDSYKEGKVSSVSQVKGWSWYGQEGHGSLPWFL